MYRPITLEEDIALKQVIASRHKSEADAHRFNWRSGSLPLAGQSIREHKRWLAAWQRR